jgi:S1-C subfamily serine protease
VSSNWLMASSRASPQRSIPRRQRERSFDSCAIRQRPGRRSGNGLLDRQCKIVTNKHVIEGEVPVIDLGGVRIPAAVELVDDSNDVAVLTTSAEMSVEVLVFAEGTPEQGSSVFAIGNPLAPSFSDPAV